MQKEKTVADTNRGQRPSRQSPGSQRSGLGEGGDPTVQRGQLPSEIFGFSQTYSTGAPGSAGASSNDSDVTVKRGQLDPGLANVEGSEITSTGASGSDGARTSGGGDTVHYTDVFGYLGGGGGEATARGHVSGSGDWTQANGDGYDSGPTLPILQNARPTSTGAGQGRVSTHRRG